MQPARKGIAMLELIFAIVVIGITLLSVPQIILTSSKSGYTALQQESVAQVSSDISLLLTREWDEAGTNDSYNSPMLHTDGNLGLSDRSGSKSRSFFTPIGSEFSASTALVDEGDQDDIDDIDSSSLTTIQSSNIDMVDRTVTIDYTVEYANDDPTGSTWDGSSTVVYNNPFSSATPASSTNIKRINAKLTSNSGVDELEKTIILNAFSCNIGSFRLERKEL